MNSPFPQLQTLNTTDIDDSLETLADIKDQDDVTSLGMAIHAMACPLPSYVISVTFDQNNTDSNKPVIRVTSRYFRQHFKDFVTKQDSKISVRLSHETKHCTVIAIELGGPA